MINVNDLLEEAIKGTGNDMDQMLVAYCVFCVAKTQFGAELPQELIERIYCNA